MGVDDASGKVSYKNGDKEQQTKPTGLLVEFNDNDMLQSGWTSKVDPASRKTYYVSSSGQSQWNKPTVTKLLDIHVAPDKIVRIGTAPGCMVTPNNVKKWMEVVRPNKDPLIKSKEV